MAPWSEHDLTEDRQAAPHAFRNAAIASAVMAAGAWLFVLRTIFERFTLHVSSDALFFGALHGDLAMLWWLAIMLFWCAHVSSVIGVLWILWRRGKWWLISPLVGLSIVAVCVGHALLWCETTRALNHS